MTTRVVEKTDVIIVGGGMVGLSLAAGLIKNKLRVIVVEATTIAGDFSFPIQIRVSAISLASENWLKSLGAWQQIPPQRLSAYRKMKIWQQEPLENDEHFFEFNATDLAQPDLGHIIENQVIVTALKKSLCEKNNESADFKLLENAQAKSLWIDSDQVELILKNGCKIQSQLIVAADGARSWVRDQLNIPLTRNPYIQKAIVALIESEKNHQKTAWQKFLSTGPVAFLPMKQKNLHSIVWTVPDELGDTLINEPEARFLEQLNNSVNYNFGHLKLASERVAFPLMATHARSYVRHRTALVGDAAHSIHPLAGQGVNLGFADAQALVTILSKAKTHEKDPGTLSLLREYERKRCLDNHLTQDAMSVINKVFLNQHQIMVMARRYGMGLLNNSTYIKKQLMQQAMGLSHK